VHHHGSRITVSRRVYNPPSDDEKRYIPSQTAMRGDLLVHLLDTFVTVPAIAGFNPAIRIGLVIRVLH